MSTTFKDREMVIIKMYKNDEYDRKGIVQGEIEKNGVVKYWVSNLNMPFYGTVSDFFTADELEKIE